MTCEEFSNEFETLLNSYNNMIRLGDIKSPNTIELDEYEKSLFLTQAQEELIQEYYTGKNPFGESYEKTEEIRRYLKNIVRDYSTSTKAEVAPNSMSPTSMFFEIPEDVWFNVYETVTFNDPSLTCETGEAIEVQPITHDNYAYMSKNPFKRPRNSKVFRMDIHSNLIEIVSKYNVETYFIRYVTQPLPIVLVDLGELSINDINTKTECELNSALHRAILKRAVNIALRRFNIAGN